MILDRGHGKAPQVIETERFDIMTEQELDRRIADGIARLRALGYGHLLGEPARREEAALTGKRICCEDEQDG